MKPDRLVLILLQTDSRSSILDKDVGIGFKPWSNRPWDSLNRRLGAVYCRIETVVVAVALAIAVCSAGTRFIS
jgi:hypothetical protein